MGVRLWVEGEHLRFKAPQGVLTPELKAALSANKPALLEILRVPAGPASPRQRHQAIVRIHEGGDRAPFFCVHPVGGNVFCYAQLARHLSAQQPFYAFQSPGLPDLDTIEAMAGHYIGCLESVQAQGPYLLGGWSMGGVIAFEMARQLRLNGLSAEIFLIDSITPAIRLDGQLPDDRTMLKYFLLDLEGTLGKPLGLSVETLETIDPSQRIHAIAELVQKHGMVPPELEPDELLPLFQMFRNNLTAFLNYRPAPYEGRVTLVRSRTTRLEENDPALGWSGLAAELEIHEIEGDHYSIVTGPDAAALAALLEEKLTSTLDNLSRTENQI